MGYGQPPPGAFAEPPQYPSYPAYPSSPAYPSYPAYPSSPGYPSVPLYPSAYGPGPEVYDPSINPFAAASSPMNIATSYPTSYPSLPTFPSVPTHVPTPNQFQPQPTQSSVRTLPTPKTDSALPGERSQVKKFMF
jgi:hypothetical protein